MLTRRQFKKLSFWSLFLYSLKGCANLDRDDVKLNSAVANRELYILWERGYLPEENQGILQLVEEWQRLTGKKVNLKLAADDFIEQSLLETWKNPNSVTAPHIVFSISFNHIIAPLLAWQDKLLDLSEVIKPIASSFQTDVLPQVLYRNQVRGDRSYYALPIGQSDAYIHYWKNSLAEIGYATTDIPREWDKFWQFWKTAQTKLRSRQHPNLYGLGLCMSANGFDTIAAFQLFLDAHNVAIANYENGLVLADTQNRQQLIHVISEFVDFYRQGYVPPDALEWSGSGNNIAFLNRQILMTLNMTLSIPRTQKLESNQYNRNAAQRYQDIVTLANYPNKLDGTTLQAPRVLNQILALKHRQQSQDTLDFLRYLLQPDNIRRLVRGFNGRILPTMPQLLNDRLWQDPADQHSAAALAIYNRPRLPEDDKLHPVFSQIYMQQLWAQIINRAIHQDASPTQAADWGIAQIRQIWQSFEKRP
jgi:multiple sugar transport system substrate-binding protein